MKRFLLILLPPLLLAGIARAEGRNVDDLSRVCMVQDRVMTEPGIPIKVAGNTYYGCCPMCSKALGTNPAKYTKATDPVTGRSVDKARAFVLDIRGAAIYFESESSRAEFARDPGRYSSGMQGTTGPPRNKNPAPSTRQEAIDSKTMEKPGV